MRYGRRVMQGILVGFAISLIAVIPAMAGSNAIGSLSGSRNTTLDSLAALPNTTIFSGDTLRVRDGVAVVALAQGSRIVFGRQTQASFLADRQVVTVVLTDGNVLLYHQAGERSMQLKAGEVTISPLGGFKTMGEVAMLGSNSLVVTARQGSFQVERQGHTMQLAEGKTLTLSTRTAQAPDQGSSGSNGNGKKAAGAWGGASTVSWVGLGAGATGAVLAAVAVSRADTSNHSAEAANAGASAATSAANAATSAANAAASAAAAAQQTANAVGCGLDQIGEALGLTTSPYVPPAGSTCP